MIRISAIAFMAAGLLTISLYLFFSYQKYYTIKQKDIDNLDVYTSMVILILIILMIA
ncbi:MAG: hypothetical protein HC906_03645 [Bacteroidales bacterium]|nr:hypothetical protein [Bacteroidales bacterium]